MPNGTLESSHAKLTPLSPKRASRGGARRRSATNMAAGNAANARPRSGDRPQGGKGAAVAAQEGGALKRRFPAAMASLTGARFGTASGASALYQLPW